MPSTKPSAFTAITALSGDEKVPVIEDPAGTPLNRLSGLPLLSLGGVLAETTLGAAAATITLSSIPSGYRHLLLAIYGKHNDATVFDFMGLRFNGDSAGNYDTQLQHGSNTTNTASVAVAASSMNIGYLPGASAPAGSVGQSEVFINNYLGTSLHKTARAIASSFQATAAAASWAHAFNSANRWRSTSAITDLTIVSGAGQFAAGTLITLYGLRAA